VNGMAKQPPSTPNLPVLQKGQLWTMAEERLLVYHTGKHLVEVRIFKEPCDPRRRKLPRSLLESIGTVQQYLQKNNAVLQKPETGV
jgi:hypothetical protein